MPLNGELIKNNKINQWEERMSSQGQDSGRSNEDGVRKMSGNSSTRQHLQMGSE